ncbi:uncharacterized protein [Spinacia oleracea]|uniref:Reverse transcriptase domain-containing protein n=1 Tax=Spinacia oleracea TaxID=3562 RepID=A0A9R0I6L9_SPIOL|nr:uncharacterized protein LOC110783602 [Spinacia oleracea]
MSVVDMSVKLACLNPRVSFGVDADGSRGGLFILSWCSAVVSCVASTQNYVLCKISESNGCSRHVLFVYGDPVLERRKVVWDRISSLLEGLVDYLVIGDFNQLDSMSDKYGGSNFIRGIDDFTDFRLGVGLHEIEFVGPRYTWVNKRINGDLIMERLDRAYASLDWMDRFPEGKIYNEPILCSDHAAIMYESEPKGVVSNRPYQLEKWSLNFKEVENLILSSWNERYQGSSMFTLACRQRNVRTRLQKWCLENKKFWGINWRMVTKSIEKATEELMRTNQGNLYIDQLSEWDSKCRIGFDYWRQRVKENWVKEGELASSLMFRRVKVRKVRNEIVSIKNDEDEWVEGQEGVSKVVLDSLLKVYVPQDNPNQGEDIDLILRQLHCPKISRLESGRMDAPITDEEIRKAMFDIGKDKSPGPDGMIAEFFQKYWDKIGEKVIEGVREFFRKGHILKEWNQALLVMIPKVASPEAAMHFRPIGLCNTIYKCVSKCMVKRLKEVLPSLISDFQHAFIPGRYIEDNILLSHEMLNTINTNKRKDLAVIKLDMSKAYDRVNWLFVLKFLKGYGFSDRWVGLVSECITTVSYKALINGRTTRGFKPKCGLRQGDPLSPYLFLFCMDIFSRMLTLGESIGLFKGIKVSRRAPSINHLFFADDAMLFFKADEESCVNLKKIIEDFGRISGQQLNYKKTHVKFSPHMKEESRARYKAILLIGEVEKLGNHLGAPIDLGRKKAEEFQLLIDKIQNKILVWSSLHLSQPMKVILIQSVLMSVVSHVMRCLKIPAAVTNKIDALVTRFFWAGKGEKGLHWVSRGIIQKPREDGGLGIRAAAMLNDAMLFKQVQRLVNNPQLLITRVISSFDGRGNNVLGGDEGKGRGASWGRRGLYIAQGKFSRGLVWKVGNGDKVLASSMAWVGGQVPEVRSNQLLGPSAKWRVSEFIERGSSTWKPDLVRSRFVWKDACSILAMEIPKGEVEDFKYWKYSRSGRFTISSGYQFLYKESAEDTRILNDNELKAIRIVWKMNILPKWKYFMWKIFYNGLAVKVNLVRRGMDCDLECSYCGCQEEDLQHVLRFCSVAYLSWVNCSLQIDPTENESCSLKEWVRRYILLYHSEDGWNGERIQRFIALLWSLWKMRNARIFRGEGGHPGAVLAVWDTQLKEVDTFKRRNKEDSSEGAREPPGFNMVHIGQAKDFCNAFVLQVDGSWDKKTGRAGWGVAVSTESQSESAEKAGQHGMAVSSDHAEAKACLLGLNWASQRQINRLRINTDSAALVSNLRLGRVVDITIMGIVEEIRNLGSTFQQCTILKVPRRNVTIAHNVATRCRKLGLSFV